MKNLFTTIFFLGGLLLCQKASAQIQGATMGNPVNIGALGGSYNTYTDTKNNSTSNGYGNEFNSSNYATGQPSDDIYYKFQLNTSAQVTLSTCGSDFDTYLHLLDGSGNEIAYNDDDHSVHCGGYGYESYIQTTLAAGTYYIVTEGYNYITGNIILNLSIQSSATSISTTNFVRTFTPRTPIPDVATLQSLSADKSQVETLTQYYDGLGRPLQTVQRQGSPRGNDLVTPVEYDEYGRERKKYLPYASTATDGEYKADALLPNSGVFDFYNPAGSNSPQLPSGVVRIANPYSETAFEPSPLNRPVEQGAPGDAWQLSTSGVLGSGHTVRTEYGSNLAADNVSLWTVNSSGNGAVTSGSYPENQLYKTTVTDENGNHTVEFKDKQGLVVCKKAESGPNTYIATYYIYDDLNNLAYVVPPIPGGSLPQSFTESDDVFTGYVYGYHYDGRNRVVEKKVPGKGWEFMVYNPLDQVTFAQDAVQRNKAGQEWSFTLYDGLGRVAMTGVYKTGSAADGNLSTPDRSKRLALANLLAAQPTLWLTRDNTTPTGYNNTAAYASITSSGQILTINYYDDYNYPGIPYTPTDPEVNSRTTGLLTGTKTTVLNPDGSYGPMLWNVNYYNVDGMEREGTIQNNVGGSDKYLSYYTFNKQLEVVDRFHSSSSISSLEIYTSNLYDHVGRNIHALSNFNHVFGGDYLWGGSYKLYNEVGQLKTKSPYSSDGAATPSSGAQFTYNSRGWLTSITHPLMTEKLFYEVPSFSGAIPNYNGNITEAWYNTPVAGDRRFSYKYDPLNRLSESRYYSGTNHTGELDELINYDDLGNITNLNRGSYGAMPYVYSGSFGYNYTAGKLQTVSNNSNPYRSYGYDYNGNITANGELNFDYNLLNLPRYIKQGNNPVVSYTYIATGEKLRKQSGVNGTTDYVDGIQYRDGIMESIETEDGRYLVGGNGKFQYSLKDHLGNVRLMYEKTTVTTPSNPVQENEYYAFGLNVARQDVSPANKYLYNGKELQNDYNLNQYDYGARFYDPVVARWGSVDPMAEISRRWSPYNYVINNPIRNTDPDGMMVTDADGSQHSESAEEAQSMFRQLQAQQDQDPPNKKKGQSGNQQKKESTIGQQMLDGTPVLGKAMSSGRKLVSGDYLGSFADISTSLAELGTLGLASEVKLATTAVTQAVDNIVTNQGTEIIAANGVKIEGFVGHAVERAIERGVKPSAILDALRNPLKIGETVIDNIGRQSQRLIGQSAEVVVNPQTGRIISVNPTSSAKAAKLIKQIAQ